MIIAISSNSANIEEQMEPRFGRATGFILYNSDTGDSGFVENVANSELAQGAGIQTAQMMSDHNVNVVISGKFGPKALAALEKGGIEMVESTGGTVRDVLESYLGNSDRNIGDRSGLSKSSPDSRTPGLGTGCRAMGGSGRGLGRGNGQGSGKGQGTGRGKGSGRGMGGGRR